MNGDERMCDGLTVSREYSPGLVDRFARSLVMKSLGLIGQCRLTLVEGNQRQTFGIL